MKTGNLSVLGLVTGLTKDEVGLGNVANELQLYASQLSTDGTMADDSSSLVPSQSAVISYVSSQIGDITGALTFKGTIDLSGNPDYPAGAVGDVYMVSVAGKIGGALGVSLTVGDLVLCITANAGGVQAVVGSDWDTIQLSINGIVVGPSSSTNNDFATFNGTSGSVIQDSGLSFSTDGTMADDSDTLVPSQKSVVTYVNSLGFLTSITSSDVTTALGYTPVESVSGTSGQISATGSTNVTLALVTTAVTPGSYTLTSLTVDAYGRITSASSYTLVESDITTALGYTPVAPASMESGENNIIAFLDSDGNLVDSHLLVTTDGTLSADSDSVVPTEKAVKTYADTKVSSVSGTSGRISSTGSTTPVLDLVMTAVTPGSYTSANITVDAYGRVTSASNGGGEGSQTPWLGDEDASGYNLYNLSFLLDPTNTFKLIDGTNAGQYSNAALSFQAQSNSYAVFTANNTLDDGGGNMTVAYLLTANSLVVNGSGSVLNVSGSTSLDSGAISTNGTGTLNLSALVATGNIQASTLTMTTGASNGYILTSDGSGNGTWQYLTADQVTTALGYTPVNSADQADSGVSISTDGTMASDSDSYVPTQKAVVTYVASELSSYIGSTHIQRGTFTDGDLVSGNVLVITHNLSLTAPFAVVISVFDNNGNQVLPDAIVGATNSVDVDLSSYGSLTGTWGWVLVG